MSKRADKLFEEGRGYLQRKKSGSLAAFHGFSQRGDIRLRRPERQEEIGQTAGLGVPAVRADSADAFVRALDRSLAESGPSLIEAVL